MAEIRGKVDTICMDYYMTLVDLKNPFKKMIDWLELYINHKYPLIDEKKFTSRFIRNRAVLGSGKFMMGMDVLVNSVKMTCERFQVKDFSNEFEAMVKTLFMEAYAFDEAVSVVEHLKKKYSVGLLSMQTMILLVHQLRRMDSNLILSLRLKMQKPINRINKYLNMH